MAIASVEQCDHRPEHELQNLSKAHQHQTYYQIVSSQGNADLAIGCPDGTLCMPSGHECGKAKPFQGT